MKKKTQVTKGKIVEMVLRNNDIWVRTDTNKIYIRQKDGSWFDLTEQF